MDTRIEDVRYTVSDIMALPDRVRAELIDGEMYMMAPPKLIHQKIIVKLTMDIANYIENKGGDCEVIPAPFGVFINKDDENYVEPDISVICDKSKLDEEGCHGAPDWIVEVVSPTSRKMDCLIKLNKYRTAGVREYWIVDPQTQKVRVYFFPEKEEKEYGFSDMIKVRIYDDLNISMEKFRTEV
ncbi:MAG: Uma2 family endonuclease [Lachnospiraceae bacterium]|nr:Uma2 family endonuclease [Lachnospiraceae bacterium]